MTDFVAIDQGNCNPRFMRATTYNLPISDDLAVASNVPLGLVIQPFAGLRDEEGRVEMVDFREEGPPRCGRCRGYINPWVTWLEGGMKWCCNLCGGVTDGSLSPPHALPQLTFSQPYSFTSLLLSSRLISKTS